jgi:hypothetical protein
MVFVLLSWVYISFLIFSIGYSLTEIIHKISGYNGNNRLSIPFILINGLFVSNVIALLFALMYKVGLAAHVSLILLSAVCYLLSYSGIKTAFRKYGSALKTTPWFIWVIFFILLLVQAYAAYMPSSHNDDGLYYSTSIKWMQEFGTIPGLANINPRIGFNSSWLGLQALFSFSFLHAGLFNDINGLLFLYVFIIFLQSFRRLWLGERTLYAFVSVLFFVPILFIDAASDTDSVLFKLNFFSSPSPDIPTCLITWLILLLCIQPENQDGSGKKVNLFLIMIYSSWVLTIKLSAVAVVIPMAFIWFSWIRQQTWKPVLVSAACMIMAVLPWCVRNIMLTGYPVFPLPATDWFSFDWKLPLHHVQWHVNAVKVSAIDGTLDLNKPFTLPIWKWFPDWFDRLSFIRSVVVLGIGAGLAGLCVLLGVRIYNERLEFVRKNIQWLLALLTCLTGIGIWLQFGPDMRFGFGFCLFFVMLGCSWVCWYFLRDHIRAAAKAFFAILVIALLYNYGSFWNGIKNNFFVRPLTPRVASQIVEIRDMGNGIHLSLVNYVDSWNTPLPCAPLIEINALRPKLRGTTLKEGFQARQ